MTPEQMLTEAELVLTDDQALRPIPRADRAGAWAILAAATTYVQRPR